MKDSTKDLAQLWFDAWASYDMDRLRRALSADFVHVSPFGRFDDRESYLEAVEPMARKSVSKLVIRQTVVEGDWAVVRYENHTPNGVVDACDWIRVEGGVIREIRAFYDTARMRELFSETEQASLDGSAEEG